MHEDGGNPSVQDRKGSGRMMLADYLRRTGESKPVIDCFGGCFASPGLMTARHETEDDGFETKTIENEAASLTPIVAVKLPAA